MRERERERERGVAAYRSVFFFGKIRGASVCFGGDEFGDAGFCFG